MTHSLFEFDKKFNCAVTGTDEAGRGPGAGGVFAAAVRFKDIGASELRALMRLDDSKKLSPKVRLELFEVIKSCSHYSIQCIEVDKIEEINILNSSLLAMKLAVEAILLKDALTLVDGNRKIKNFPHPQQLITKGDSKSASIAAASILAKVSRDFYMQQLHEKYPQYNWAKNKGYLTPEHIRAIKTHGACEFHRRGFLKKIVI